jgi:hypothetical protein
MFKLKTFTGKHGINNYKTRSSALISGKYRACPFPRGLIYQWFVVYRQWNSSVSYRHPSLWALLTQLIALHLEEDNSGGT